MTDCRDTNAVLGCFNDGTNPPVTVMVTHVHDFQGAPAVVITDLVGAVVAGATAANTTLGACALASPDVEFNELCDIQADGSSIQFARRTITSVNGLGVPTVAVADFEMDYATAYTPTGTVGQCPSCAELAARGLQTAW